MTDLSPHADAVAAAFGLGRARALEGPVASGHTGAVWRLETERGRYAVKVPDEPDPDAAAADAAVQEAFVAGGVPLPRPVRTPDGQVLAEVAGHRVRVHAWVDVAAEDRHLDPAAVGRLLAALHSVVLEADGPVDGWYADPVGAPAWAALLDELRTAGAPYAERLAALVPGVVAAEAGYRPPDVVQVCHRDLWADNLRATADGTGLVVLDWEDAGPASPSQELAVVLLEHGAGDPERWRTIHAAYTAAGGPGRVAAPEDFSMVLAQQGQLVREGCRRWLADPDPAARAANEAWVAEFLDEPFDLALVDRVLAALSTPRRGPPSRPGG